MFPVFQKKKCIFAHRFEIIKLNLLLTKHLKINIMKKVFRIFALATLALGTTLFIACGDDEENNGGGGGGNNGETGDPVLLDETFDNGLPQTWTLIDADGDGVNWTVSTTYFSSPEGVDGTECMVSPSYVNNVGPLSSDNYLITPTIHIPGAGGYSLTYSVASFQKEFPDYIYVMVGTMENGNFVSQGTLSSEEVDNAIITAASGSAQPAEGFATRSFNLDQFKGQDVCIAFRHNSEDCYFLCLDNVKISNEASKGESYIPVKAKNATPKM